MLIIPSMLDINYAVKQKVLSVSLGLWTLSSVLFS
jgi:hypothetical protein